MQIVSFGDNLHEMSNPVSGKIKKKYFNMSSTQFSPSMQSVETEDDENMFFFSLIFL